MNLGDGNNRFVRGSDFSDVLVPDTDNALLRYKLGRLAIASYSARATRWRIPLLPHAGGSSLAKIPAISTNHSTLCQRAPMGANDGQSGSQWLQSAIALVTVRDRILCI